MRKHGLPLVLLGALSLAACGDAQHHGNGTPQLCHEAAAGAGTLEDCDPDAPSTVTPVEGWDEALDATEYVRTPTLHGHTIFISHYAWHGSYLDFETWDLDNDPRVVSSDRCIIEFENFEGRHCMPITLGNYALEKYSKYATNAPEAESARARFIEVADWFRAHQDERGGWPFDYDHEWWPARAATLEAGWYSAMAQGLAISTLVRAFYLSGESSYLDAAGRAVAILRTSVAAGGVMRRLDGHVFYEEYPTTPMSNVLNGYLFSLIGLYDLSQVAAEPAYAEFFAEGVATVQAVISRYDLGGFTAYDLSHLQHPGAAPNRARWAYHSVHVTQLSWLRSVTADDAFFSPLIERWDGYSNDVPVREN